MSIVDDYEVCGITFRLPIAFKVEDVTLRAVDAWLIEKYPELQKFREEHELAAAEFEVFRDPINAWLKEKVRERPDFKLPPTDHYAEGKSLPDEYRRVLLTEGQQAANSWLIWAERARIAYHEHMEQEQHKARREWRRNLHQNPEYVQLTRGVDLEEAKIEITAAKYARALNIAALVHEEEILVFLVTGEFPK